MRRILRTVRRLLIGFFLICIIVSVLNPSGNTRSSVSEDGTGTELHTLTQSETLINDTDQTTIMFPIREPADGSNDSVSEVVIQDAEKKVEALVDPENSNFEEELQAFDISTIPDYSGKPYVVVNEGEPYFTDTEKTTHSFEKYSDLDSLGRCGAAIACIGTDIMPTAPRGTIGAVRPTGWHTVKYAGIDGNYLYNRCHLIAYELAGENANEKNLITGTRYLNIEGMLPFENEVADYVKYSGNHVLYRVTPIFENENLLASGVLMEGISVEDDGAGIKFNVFCYNVQPGITIDYTTGESTGEEYSGSDTAKYDGVDFSSPAVIAIIQQSLNNHGYDCGSPDGIAGTATANAIERYRNDHSISGNSIDAALALALGVNAYDLLDASQKDVSKTSQTDIRNGQTGDPTDSSPNVTYIINMNTGKFHYPDCNSVSQMAEHNKKEYTGLRDDLIRQGYEPCQRCNP